MEFYNDSDHAGDGKSGDVRSTTGVIILLNGMPVSWQGNKQPKTSLSSACAETHGSRTQRCQSVDAIKVNTTTNLADMLTECLTYPAINALEVLLQDLAKSIAKTQAI